MTDNIGQNPWVQLVDYRRNGVPEVTIHGAISFVHGREVFYSWGGNVLCYGRSMMKPLQMKVFSKEFENYFNWEQKAISISSHNGDTEHTRVVKSMIKKSELGLIQTPHATPLVQFGKQRRRPRRWFHPCSGKHAAIITGCKLKGWSRVGYILPQHPFHQAYLKIISQSLGDNWQPRVTAKDGCGLPTLSMTVNELAALFSSLVRERDHDWVWEAFMRHPDLIGGFNRLDSTILKSGGGKVLAKEGADGLLGLALEHEDFPKGLGIVIKIAHGWDTQATWYVARYVLGVLGIQLRNPYPLDRQKAFIVPEVIPENYRSRIKNIEPWDPWDPNRDRWDFNFKEYVTPQGW